MIRWRMPIIASQLRTKEQKSRDKITGNGTTKSTQPRPHASSHAYSTSSVQPAAASRRSIPLSSCVTFNSYARHLAGFRSQSTPLALHPQMASCPPWVSCACLYYALTTRCTVSWPAVSGSLSDKTVLSCQRNRLCSCKQIGHFHAA